MALFIDDLACGIDDLTDQDSGLLEVAEGSGINVNTKIRLAQDEIESELELWLQKGRSESFLPGGQRLRVAQAVVTTPLKRWLVFHSLEMVYRDSYYSQLVDRYQAKWREFVKLSRDAREGLLGAGLGMVSDPLRQPLPPVLTTGTGPQNGGSFYASVAWVGGSGQESAASAAASLRVEDGHVMVVNPPPAPNNAQGYRVYGGSTLDGLVLQTPIALPLTVTFRYLPGQVTHGPGPGSGQLPEVFRPLPRTWMRG